MIKYFITADAQTVNQEKNMAKFSTLIIFADKHVDNRDTWKFDHIECQVQILQEKYEQAMENIEFETESRMCDYFGEDGWELKSTTPIELRRGGIRNKYYFTRAHNA